GGGAACAARARTALLAALRPARRGHPPARLGRRSRRARGARGRGVAGRVRTTAAGRPPCGNRRNEPVIIPPALPRRDLALAAAIPETVAPDRGAAPDDVGRHLGEQRRFRSRL